MNREATSTTTTEPGSAEAEAIQRFKDGMFCAESVVMTLARRQGIDSPILPAIATGFCSGLGRTAGPCGALTGAIMGLGLAFGREGAGEPIDAAYKAVQRLVQQFTQEFGSTACAELLGCHLGTEEGQKAFKEGQLYTRCLAYTGRAAELAAQLIEGDGA